MSLSFLFTSKLWAVAAPAFFVLMLSCGGDPSPAPTPIFGGEGPVIPKESLHRNSAINHEQGKSSHGFFMFGDFKGSQAAQDAVARGAKRTTEVLEIEYPGRKMPAFSKFAVVFWKPWEQCVGTGFAVAYIVMDPNDPYDRWGDYNLDDEYDKDNRKGRVAICVTGKAKLHTWLNGTKYDGESSLYRMDIVEDAGQLGEGTARHEWLHLGLLALDPQRFNETFYHAGDWETLMAKVEPRAVEGAKRIDRKVAKVRGIIDGEEQEFQVEAVK